MRTLRLLLIPFAGGLPAIRTPAQKTPFKAEVDTLVAKVRARGAKTSKEAAIFLVALRHCHRRYDMQDGPLVREPRKRIYGARRDDGLFGPEDDARATTAWVYQALHDLDAETHKADLAVIRASFGKRFRLAGEALDRALRPYPAVVAAEITNVHETFRELIGLVQAQEAAMRGVDSKKARVAPFEPFQQAAVDWLMKQQERGMWLVPGPEGHPVPDPGITALALAAVATKPAASRSESENAALKSGVEFLLQSQKRAKNGSFSDYVPNYVTCAAIMALTRLEGVDVDQKALREALAKAQAYLLRIQNVEHNSYLASDRDYGSIGYGGDQRGDLSNTQMAVEALRATGLDVQDEAFAKALVFLRRVQNLPGKDGFHGSRTIGSGQDAKKVRITPGEDGGAQYYPGNSPAGYDESSDGKQVPRSYGSMTYALLKCYVLCGLPKDDPRLQAALNWCLSHYTLDFNPGFKPELGEKAKYQGLFYYYLALARALNLAEVEEIQGKNWRQELRAKLRSLQKPDGFWVNDRSSRWWENMPVLCTAYALLALAE